MVKCCSNALCEAEFRSFYAGDLYALETRSGKTELFWLCPECVGKFGLSVSGAGKVGVCELTPGYSPICPNREYDLRLLPRGRRFQLANDRIARHAMRERVPLVAA